MAIRAPDGANKNDDNDQHINDDEDYEDEDNDDFNRTMKRIIMT